MDLPTSTFMKVSKHTSPGDIVRGMGYYNPITSEDSGFRQERDRDDIGDRDAFKTPRARINTVQNVLYKFVWYKTNCYEQASYVIFNSRKIAKRLALRIRAYVFTHTYVYVPIYLRTYAPTHLYTYTPIDLRTYTSIYRGA